MRKLCVILMIWIFYAASSFAEGDLQNEFDQASNWAKSLIKTPGESDISLLREVETELTPHPKEASYNVSQLEQKSRSERTHESLEIARESEKQLAPVTTIVEESWIKGSDGLYEKIIEKPEQYIATQYEDCKQVPIVSTPILEEQTLKCKESIDIELNDILNLKIGVKNYSGKKTYFFKDQKKHYDAIMGAYASENNLQEEPYGDLTLRHYGFNSDKRLSKYKVTTPSTFYLERSFSHLNINPKFIKSITFFEEIPGWGHVSPKIEYTYEYHKITSEKWLSSNPLLNDLNESGYCDIIGEACIEGPETKIINGLEVKRECWRKKLTYKCGSHKPSKCPNYRKLGCEQTEHKCIKLVGDQCIEVEKTYHCKKMIQNPTGKYKLLCGDIPFCLNGDCVFDGYEANHDMLEAVSKLKIFEELGKQIKKGNLNIFTGQCGRCRKNAFGFRSCCGKGNGWGKSFGAKCSEGEKTLAHQRTKGLCHYVGTYCSKKVLGKCVEKKQSHCCFKSKIQRLLQEQIRSQLGISWGSGKRPQCRGLTIAELSKADWEKLDLSELFNEILDQLDIPDTDSMMKGMRIKPSIDGSKIPSMSALGASVNLTVKNKLNLRSLKSSTKSGLILPKGKE